VSPLGQSLSVAHNCGLNMLMVHDAAHILLIERPPEMLTMAQQAPPSQSPPMQARFSMGPASPPDDDEVEAPSSPEPESLPFALPPEDELLHPAPATRARPSRELIKRMLLVCIVKKPFVARGVNKPARSVASASWKRRLTVVAAKLEA